VFRQLCLAVLATIGTLLRYTAKQGACLQDDAYDDFPCAMALLMKFVAEPPESYTIDRFQCPGLAMPLMLILCYLSYADPILSHADPMLSILC
jgi:hypothetical protein